MKRFKEFYRKIAGRFPLTLWGLVFLLLCAGSFWFLAVKKLDLVYLALSTIWTFIFILIFIWVLIVASHSRKRIKDISSGSFLRMTVGFPACTGFYVPSFTWTPFIQISWTWESPGEVSVLGKREEGRLMEIATPGRRGFHDGIKRKIEIGDVFGFTRIRWEVKEELHIQILPDHGNLRNMNMLLSLFKGEDISHPEGMPEGDRIEIRQYAAGDSIKTIMWKIFAQSRKLFVRIPEKAVNIRPRVAAYLISGRGDEPSASLARVLLENRMLGREWIFGADGSPVPATDLGDALKILSKSGNEKSFNPEGLYDFLEYSASRGVQHCIILLPPDISGWKEGIKVMEGTKIRAHFMIAFDSRRKEQGDYREKLRSFLIEKEEREKVLEPDIKSIIGALPRVSGSLFLIDRRTGKLFREEHIGAKRCEQKIPTN